MRFLDDGCIELDNNRSKRSIKPFVIGRKNWLFADTAKGARADATIYRIIQTAKEYRMNPYPYLDHPFEILPNLDSPYETTLEAVLPWRCDAPLVFRCGRADAYATSFRSRTW